MLIHIFAPGSTKRKPTMSLAVYDIELLKAWYTHNFTEQGKFYASSNPWLILDCRVHSTRCYNARL